MKKRKFNLSELDIVKLIFILALSLILLEHISDFFVGFFRINLGWFLIYCGAVYYFMLEGRPSLKSWNYIRNSKNYIWFVSLILFCFALIGFMLPIFFQEQIFELIQELVEKTEGLDFFNLIRFIFINNLKSSFFVMVLGIFFGLIPLAVIVINGYVLGFVANKAIISEGVFVLWRLFPHGIFELPAVLISIAIGARLGMFLFISENKSWGEFWKWIKDALRVFVCVVIPLLTIAAIIEGSLIYLIG